MLNQIEEQFSTSVSGAWFIGDTEKDIGAARAKGCKPILVLTGKGSLTKHSASKEILENVPIFDDLFSAAMFIVTDQGAA